MKITAVVPQWNRRDLLVSLLDNLRLQTRSFTQIIVVDNGSNDGSAQVAEQKGAQVIALDRNYGFAYAVNRGLEAATGEWVAILNNDVTLHPDWLDRILSGAGDQWFAAGKLLSASRPDIVDGTYDLLCRGAIPWRAGCLRQNGPLWDTRRTVSFIPFTAAIFRRELFDKVGMLDEEFESYLEDVEFGLRCALKGYQGAYVPDAVGRHIGSATLGAWNKETARRLARNRLLLIAKHYPHGWIWRYGWSVFVAQSLCGLAAMRHGAGFADFIGKAQALKGFRQRPETDAARLAEVLTEGETEIRRLQKDTGFDLLWRLYFSLT